MKLQQLLESEFDNIDPTNLADKREWLTAKKEAAEKEQKSISDRKDKIRAEIRNIMQQRYPAQPFKSVLEIEGVPEIVDLQQKLSRLHEKDAHLGAYIKNLTNQITPNKNTGKFAWQFIVMTGFRDANLEMYIDANGGTVQNNVNNKTTLLVTTDVSKDSSKKQKAKSLGIQIMTLTAFKQRYGIK